MQISVNYEEIQQSAKVLESKANQYDEIIQSLYARMHEMQAIWQGKDNQAFIDQLERFQPELQKMKTVIEQYSSYLLKSASLYEQLQQDRIAQARKLL